MISNVTKERTDKLDLLDVTANALILLRVSERRLNPVAVLKVLDPAHSKGFGGGNRLDMN